MAHGPAESANPRLHMFVQIDGNGDLKDIITIPDQADFDRWRGGLSDAEYDAIRPERDRPPCQCASTA